MSYKDITPGDKLGTVRGARIVKPKETLGMEVSFDFIEPSTGTYEKLLWVGWLSEGAMPYTMDTLVNVLGFNGNDEIDDNGVLVDSKALDYGREVRLVVEMEEYNGKTYPKIKWVNRVGGTGFKSADPKTVKADLAACGIKAAFLAAKQTTTKENEVPF